MIYSVIAYPVEKPTSKETNDSYGIAYIENSIDVECRRLVRHASDMIVVSIHASLCIRYCTNIVAKVYHGDSQ